MTLNQGLINHHNNGLTSESSKTMKGPTELFLTSGYSDEAAYQQYLQRVLAKTSNMDLHMHDDTVRSSPPTAALLPRCPQGKQDSSFPLAPHEKTVYPRTTDHVFQPDPKISLLTRAAWDKHPDWATLCESIIAGATAAAMVVTPGCYSWMRPRISST